jgi:hypothetical protein
MSRQAGSSAPARTGSRSASAATSSSAGSSTTSARTRLDGSRNAADTMLIAVERLLNNI